MSKEAILMRKLRGVRGREGKCKRCGHPKEHDGYVNCSTCRDEIDRWKAAQAMAWKKIEAEEVPYIVQRVSDKMYYTGKPRNRWTNSLSEAKEYPSRLSVSYAMNRIKDNEITRVSKRRLCHDKKTGRDSGKV